MIEEASHLTLLLVVIGIITLLLIVAGAISTIFFAGINKSVDGVSSKLDEIRTDHIKRIEFEALRARVEIVSERQTAVIAHVDDVRSQLTHVLEQVVLVRERTARMMREEKGE